MDTKLSAGLRAADGADDEARRLADAFDAAAAGFYADPPTVSAKQFLGAWARARRRYCELTGESLV